MKINLHLSPGEYVNKLGKTYKCTTIDVCSEDGKLHFLYTDYKLQVVAALDYWVDPEEFIFEDKHINYKRISIPWNYCLALEQVIEYCKNNKEVKKC